MTKTITYKAEEIFEDIEGDDKNVLMNIPPEIQEKMGWKEGDILKINIEQGVVTITKVEKENNGEE